MVKSSDLGFKFRKFLFFLPNSILNVRKSHEIWGNWLKNKNVTGKKQIGSGKDPPVLIELKCSNFITRITLSTGLVWGR